MHHLSLCCMCLYFSTVDVDTAIKRCLFNVLLNLRFSFAICHCIPVLVLLLVVNFLYETIAVGIIGGIPHLAITTLLEVFEPLQLCLRSSTTFILIVSFWLFFSSSLSCLLLLAPKLTSCITLALIIFWRDFKLSPHFGVAFHTWIMDLWFSTVWSFISCKVADHANSFLDLMSSAYSIRSGMLWSVSNWTWFLINVSLTVLCIYLPISRRFLPIVHCVSTVLFLAVFGGAAHCFIFEVLTNNSDKFVPLLLLFVHLCIQAFSTIFSCQLCWIPTLIDMDSAFILLLVIDTNFQLLTIKIPWEQAQKG